MRWRRFTRRIALATLIAMQARPALAYLELGVSVGGRQVKLAWPQATVRYSVSNAGVPGVSATDFQAAVGRAFATWEAVPTAAITYQFNGFTSALPGRDDGTSTLGFQNRPDLDRVLAATSFVTDSVSGALIESDIFFNSAFAWSVAPNGEANRFDVESIALHEIGHMSGLSHSALGETELRAGGGRLVTAAETVMFPIAYAVGSVAGRTLRADDITGITDLYPSSNPSQPSGSISGRVTKNGTPVFGAHVVAFDPVTHALVGSFTLDAQGRFAISSLPPGPRVLRVEPLDDAEIDSFFDPSRNVDIDFRVAFVDRIVVVPRGGDSGEVTIEVVPK
ncbi:MAG TPA: matrixin family metalloprotease [Vicinamibacterales bacterium]|nr:matrixin family metalloprotease [Vicinamibacterales bacterium]